MNQDNIKGLLLNNIPQSTTSLRNRMSGDQEAHLRDIKMRIQSDIDKKYRKGQAEHGGNLWERPIMPEIRSELIDFICYQSTLDDRIRTVVFQLELALALKTEKAKNNAIKKAINKLGNI